MLAITFLHAVWKLVDHLLKRLVVGDRGVGNVARSSAHSITILKLVSAWHLLKMFTAIVANKKKVSQRRPTVLAVTIHTVKNGGNV
jgi:hypothetical protein